MHEASAALGVDGESSAWPGKGNPHGLLAVLAQGDPLGRWIDFGVELLLAGRGRGFPGWVPRGGAEVTDVLALGAYTARLAMLSRYCSASGSIVYSTTETPSLCNFSRTSAGVQ